MTYFKTIFENKPGDKQVERLVNAIVSFIEGCEVYPSVRKSIQSSFVDIILKTGTHIRTTL